MDGKDNNIKTVIKDLEIDFNKLFLYNPLLNFCSEKKGWRSYLNKYIVVIIISILIGVGLSLSILYRDENHSHIFLLSQLTISVILPFFLFLLGKQNLTKSNIIFALIAILLIAFGNYLLLEEEKNNQILSKILPFGSFILLIIIYIYLYMSVGYSKSIIKTIAFKIDALEKELHKINTNTVQESHLKVLNKISTIEKKINKDKDALFKIHSLSILDSLRLELIKNSINGINLVKDWQHLDLSQNMINDITDCNNKHITIVGDLSFLSDEDGLKMLMETIVRTEKTFYIYFTGDLKPNMNDVIKSPECELFISNFEENIFNYNSNEQDKIKKNIELIPIISNIFTGIGFIGISSNNGQTYEKVYSYISSFIIKEATKGTTKKDIIRANPFVFSWKNKTDYFSNFIKLNLNNALKVEIGRDIIEANNLLK